MLQEYVFLNLGSLPGPAHVGFTGAIARNWLYQYTQAGTPVAACPYMDEPEDSPSMTPERLERWVETTHGFITYWDPAKAAERGLWIGNDPRLALVGFNWYPRMQRFTFAPLQWLFRAFYLPAMILWYRLRWRRKGAPRVIGTLGVAECVDEKGWRYYLPSKFGLKYDRLCWRVFGAGILKGFAWWKWENGLSERPDLWPANL